MNEIVENYSRVNAEIFGFLVLLAHLRRKKKRMKFNQKLIVALLLGFIALSATSCARRQHSCAAYDRIDQTELAQ
jgi:hypothetical protein